MAQEPFAKALHLWPQQRVGPEMSVKGMIRPLDCRQGERQAEGSVVEGRAEWRTLRGDAALPAVYRFEVWVAWAAADWVRWNMRMSPAARNMRL